MLYDLSQVPADVVQQIYASEKFTKWFSEFPTKLLNIDNPKTVKGEKYGIRTAVLYLSPAKKSGVNLCPMSHVAKCEGPCLDEAGRGAMSSVQMSRLRKTLFMLQHWDDFKAMLLSEVLTHAKYCAKHDLRCAVRLNGTTDIRWEDKLWDDMVSLHRHHGVQWPSLIHI